MRGSLSHHSLRHRHVGREVIVLPQHSETHIRTSTHSTAVGWLNSREESHQRALARAVSPYNSNARALAHAHTHRVEQRLVAVRLAHALDADQIAGGHALDCRAVTCPQVWRLPSRINRTVTGVIPRAS